jgi:HEAT repeat protein
MSSDTEFASFLVNAYRRGAGSEKESGFELRAGVIHALGGMHTPPNVAITFLGEVAGHSETPLELRRAAVVALGKIGPAAQATVPALTKLLSGHDRELRDAALRALARIEQ